MRFCLTSDAPRAVLKKADEIKISYHYCNKVLNLIE